MRRWFNLVVALSVLVHNAYAIGQGTCVSFRGSTSTFPVVSDGKASPIATSADDWPGVHIAAANLASDIQKVTGATPTLSNTTTKLTGPTIIIGTLGHSSLIDQIINATQLDVSSIQGKWEAFMAVEVRNPLPGVSVGYAIIGADKRGTIFGLYDHAEQFGVSPWYWWADVPVKTHNELYVASSGCSHGSPTVRYRGIFLNDEQPALQNWALEKFTNGTGAALTGSPFNHLFYSKVFELMLRLKANYMWPAQWGSAFGVDDMLNQPLADLYGIAMGTSHQEPMMRSTPNEWNLFETGPWNYTSNQQNVHKYFVKGAQRAKPYESIFTLGMRGAGDLPLDETTNIDLLDKVITDQRQILTDVYNGTDIRTIPQIWALYKEVESYYYDGLKVPDDVTLLWADDNWGNIRRYPTADERNRTGGSGVYYHFDYVGDPRNYKWLTSTQISKVYEQMSLAVDRNATNTWIVNVGDLKPYEREIEFFISYGWNATRWNSNNLNDYVSAWAQREFGFKDNADAVLVSHIVANLTRFNSRRKPEMLNPTTFSLVNYREAERVLTGWDTLRKASTKLYNALPPVKKPAFFQLVHHPVIASANLGELYVTAGKNNLYASQARYSTNELADQAEVLFDTDYEIEQDYHELLNGKWNHMMDQTHINYYYWQQPMMNTMPPIVRIQRQKQALAGVMRIGLEGNLGAWPGDNPNQCDQGYNCPPPTITLDSFSPTQNRYIDVGAGGPNPFTFTVISNATWAKVSMASGSVSTKSPEHRVLVSVDDWSGLPEGANVATIKITATAVKQPLLAVAVILVATRNTLPDGFLGFVEGDGVISFEAGHASRNTSVNGISWRELPDYGRTLSGVTPWPRTGNDGKNFTAGAGPSLEYNFYNFNTLNRAGTVNITTFVSPSLNANGLNRPLAFALQVDDQAPQIKYFIPAAAPGQLPSAWSGIDGFVANSIVPVASSFTSPAGAHTFKIWMIEPGVVVQKIVIDAGGLKKSYLGPPESIMWQ